MKTLIFLTIGLLTSCSITDETHDITSDYSKSFVLPQGYHLGRTYILQKDLMVTVDSGRSEGSFCKPGDSVPTVEQWNAGIRRTTAETTVAMVPAGSRLRVAKIFHILAKGSGVTQATGMLQAEGVDVLINPFAVSHFMDGPPYGTLCMPNSEFLLEE